MKKNILFALIMGIITTGLISFVLILINTDYSGVDFLKTWGRSWVIGYVLVIPCILLISPIVQTLIDKYIDRGKASSQRIK